MSEVQAIIVTSITLKHLGVKAGAKVLAQKDDVKELALGRVWGIATGSGSRMNDDGTSSEWLNGNFAIQRYPQHEDEAVEEFRSSKAYLNQLHSMIEEQLTDENGNPIRGARVSFGYEIIARRDGNKAGFTWVFRPLLPKSAASDPLTMMRDQIERAQSDKPAAIAAPKGKAKAKHEDAAVDAA